jgi:hypothetical protein
MKKKKILIILFLLIICFRLYSQDAYGDDYENDIGVPIPGILYFLFALIGVGAKKLYNARHKK